MLIFSVIYSLLFHCNNLQERASILRYMFIACLVTLFPVYKFQILILKFGI